ncbi:hypothetical protein J2Z66_004399 [Paenibacillus eucommiae]|uniref:Uncharacterized protein n=1 Tax=Paenibacillus eucommiae TaxID=1355755 RepID=A0ABS4J0Y2_9BACL|nr:hypothetical protein [Paenibacillus eucommiae]
MLIISEVLDFMRGHHAIKPLDKRVSTRSTLYLLEKLHLNQSQKILKKSQIHSNHLIKFFPQPFDDPFLQP